MLSFERYLENQRHRLIFFGLLEALFISTLTLLVSIFFFFLVIYFLVPSVRFFGGLEPAAFWLGLTISLSIFCWSFWKQRNRFLYVSLVQACEVIESQSPYFRLNPLHRSELRTVGYFLENQDHPTRSFDFHFAHVEKWKLKLSDFVYSVRPRYRLLASSVAIFVLISTIGSFFSMKGMILPSHVRAWNPEQFEILLPHQDATWQVDNGALSGVEGSKVRFESPNFGIFTPYLFVKEIEDSWKAIPCQERCEFKLHKRGRYAVGTLFYRSAYFPLQVFADEKPKGVLFAKRGEELIPEATIDLLNIEEVALHMTASDDIHIKKIRLLHQFEDQEEVLFEKPLQAKRYKADFTLSVEGWKGGSHHIFLEVSDASKIILSLPITIQYADEETLRQERLKNLEVLITEWVHVLGDLIETEIDKKLHPMLRQRLNEMEFPESGEAELINAYVKELSLLRERILKWIAMPNFNETTSFIERVERQILYGLSLIFQEKSGDIRDSSDRLTSSRESIEKLLQNIRNGEQALDSKQLQEAFDKLNKALEELREKMKNLPQGPNDEMINREAMQEQMDQSEQLSERIKQIQEQIANGDDAGALNELESLMNQLSILSKSIDRALQQMKENVDKGAIQASKEFLKQLEEVRNQQETLKDQTTKLKERLEAENKQLKPTDPKIKKQIEEDLKKAHEEQEGLEKKLEEAVKMFDEKMKGSEWEPLFRSEESKNLEEEAGENMNEAGRAIKAEEGFQAVAEQREAIEALRKLAETQEQKQKQAMQSIQPPSREEVTRSQVDIISSQGKGERERRRKILESLQKKVDKPYQKSHEQYFEELLQR